MRTLEVSVQTGNWYDEERPEESIRFIKDCGFEGLDYNINNVFDATFDAEKLTSFFDKSIEDIFAYYEPLKNAANKYDISFSQFHGLFPMYFPNEEAKNDYVIAVMEKMMAVCKYLDCKYIVTHPWINPDIKKEEEMAINLKVYRRLIPAAKKYGVKICLENLFRRDQFFCYEGVCVDAGEVCRYIDTLNEEAGEEIFGFCLDLGHANVLKKNLYQYITALGNRLSVLHIHDNNGTCDTHGIPYTQRDVRGKNSTINWDGFLRGLQEIGYEGPLAFETFRAIDAFPPALRGEGLRLVSAVGRYFRNRICGCEKFDENFEKTF